MIFLFGTQIREKQSETTRHYCVVCKGEREFLHQVLQRYFTVFFFPIWPFEKVVDTWCCGQCGFSQDIESSSQASPIEPLIVTVMKPTLSYLALGYGVEQVAQTVAELITKFTDVKMNTDDLIPTVADCQSHGLDIIDFLTKQKQVLTFPERERLLLALGTIVKCYSDWTFDDQVKVNMLGSHLDIDMSYTQTLMRNISKH